MVQGALILQTCSECFKPTIRIIIILASLKYMNKKITVYLLSNCEIVKGTAISLQNLEGPDK